MKRSKNDNIKKRPSPFNGGTNQNHLKINSKILFFYNNSLKLALENFLLKCSCRTSIHPKRDHPIHPAINHHIEK